MINVIITLSRDSKVKTETRSFNDGNHLENYIKFISKKGYKVMGVTTL
jgi:hypothetical protein